MRISRRYSKSAISTVEFGTRCGAVQAVENVASVVAKGETLGIVGECGSGKSVTAFTVMRILDRAGHIAGGSVTFGGIDCAQRRKAPCRNCAAARCR